MRRTRCFGGFLRTLKERGLTGVRLVISGQHVGLVAALRRVLQGVAHQRCRVHFARNLLALVPKSHKDMVAAVFRTIFAQPDPATVAATWDSVGDQLAAAFPKIRPLMDEAQGRGTRVHRVSSQPLALKELHMGLLPTGGAAWPFLPRFGEPACPAVRPTRRQ